MTFVTMKVFDRELKRKLFLQSLHTVGGGKSGQPMVKEMEEEKKVRIRKLTPRECFRLMGFDDEDFEKAQKVNSDTQLYKQAGNSIVVQVLESIFREML